MCQMLGAGGRRGGGRGVPISASSGVQQLFVIEATHASIRIGTGARGRRQLQLIDVETPPKLHFCTSHAATVPRRNVACVSMRLDGALQPVEHDIDWVERGRKLRPSADARGSDVRSVSSFG